MYLSTLGVKKHKFSFTLYMQKYKIRVMAYTEKELKQRVRNEIKGYIHMRGHTYQTVADLITKAFGKRVTAQSLNNKIMRGSLRYIDLLQICFVLNYRIMWEDTMVE